MRRTATCPLSKNRTGRLLGAPTGLPQGAGEHGAYNFQIHLVAICFLYLPGDVQLLSAVMTANSSGNCLVVFQHLKTRLPRKIE